MKQNSTFIATFLTALHTDAKAILFHSKSEAHEQQQIDTVGFCLFWFFFKAWGKHMKWPRSYLVRRQQEPDRKTLFFHPDGNSNLREKSLKG